MKNCIIWTRVSTKYQKKNGASLADKNVNVNYLQSKMDIR